VLQSLEIASGLQAVVRLDGNWEAFAYVSILGEKPFHHRRLFGTS